MSLTIAPKLKRRMLALALVPAGILLAMPAAQASVAFRFGFPLIVPPPVVVAPPAFVAPPPAVAVPTPYYYARPPVYYYTPGYGYFWYDRFGRRHWRY